MNPILAVAYVSFPKETDAVLHLGHGGKVKAWFAGKPVHEGAADAKASVDRAQVAVKAPEGPAALVLRLEVRGEGQDDFAARFTTADGKTIPGLRVLAVRPFPAALLSIAGTIRDAKGPVAGAEVRLSGGKNLKTKHHHRITAKLIGQDCRCSGHLLQCCQGQQAVGRSVAHEGVAGHTLGVQPHQAERGGRVDALRAHGADAFVAQRPQQARAQEAGGDTAKKGHRLRQPRQAQRHVEGAAADTRVQLHAGGGVGDGKNVH